MPEAVGGREWEMSIDGECDPAPDWHSALAGDVVARLRACGSAPSRVVSGVESCRTAAEAAALVGVAVERIGKSLLFIAEREEAGLHPFVVIAHGGRRVPVAPLESVMKAPVRAARAREVREITGYEIGGVPPFGHARTLPTFIDRHLLDLGHIWVSGGTVRSMMEIEARELLRLTGGRPLILHEDVAASSSEEDNEARRTGG